MLLAILCLFLPMRLSKLSKSQHLHYSISDITLICISLTLLILLDEDLSFIR